MWLMTKDSEMTLSFIADAYGRCLGLFVLLLVPEPCNCLVALRLGIFFVLYPAVISYLWFYYIPTRSIPK